MKVASAVSQLGETSEAFSQGFTSLHKQLGTAPDMLFVFASADHDREQVLASLAELCPQTPVLGTTSCQGLMTESGFSDGVAGALGMLGIYDPSGAYGTGLCLLGNDARLASRQALLQALETSGRPCEVPSVVFMSSAPGYEEQVIAGIQEVLGTRVLIMGGSSADQDVSGQWWQFCQGCSAQDAVVLAVLFPSAESLFYFHSGYDPTPCSATVTRAQGRILHELDGEDAAKVYNRWTEGLLDPWLPGGGNILAATTLWPLGRLSGQIGPVKQFQLSHPDTVFPDGSMSLFSDVSEGETLWLMQGTPASLISRAGHVARSALGMAEQIREPDILGALVVYCAGCMLAVRERMPEVVEELQQALYGKPFLGLFSFGEQGCLGAGRNVHGNLMISVLIFYSLGADPEG